MGCFLSSLAQLSVHLAHPATFATRTAPGCADMWAPPGRHRATPDLSFPHCYPGPFASGSRCVRLTSQLSGGSHFFQHIRAAFRLTTLWAQVVRRFPLLRRSDRRNSTMHDSRAEPPSRDPKYSHPTSLYSRYKIDLPFLRPSVRGAPMPRGDQRDRNREER